MANHKFKSISLIFPVKLQIQINLLNFSCQKCKLEYIFLIFHLKSQIQLNSLILCIKIANSNQFTGFFFQRHKFKYIFMINFLDFSCQNSKFKSIYWIFLVKDTNSNVFSWFFMVYYKFRYFLLLFILWKFKFEWMWRIFLVTNASFLLLICNLFTTFSNFYFWQSMFFQFFLVYYFNENAACQKLKGTLEILVLDLNLKMPAIHNLSKTHYLY